MLAQNLLDLVEPLAAIEHERWAHWQRYLHSQCSKNNDGSLTIPRELVERWERQLNTPYHNLSKKEQDSDKEQVRQYLDFILKQIKVDE
jgi:hypothetical protein